MDVEATEQSKPEDSSVVHPDSNNVENTKSGDDNGKFTCAVESSSFTPQSSTSFSSSDLDLLYQNLQKLQCNKPKKRRLKARRKSGRSGCNRSNRGKCGGNVCRGRQMCNCAAGYVADCAAICCCPCALLHLFILAFVVAPCALARKAYCYVRKKANPKLSETNNNGDDDDERGKDEYFTPPWSSCAQSPVCGSLRPQIDTEMVWWELYAAGHMGFGGLPFERD